MASLARAFTRPAITSLCAQCLRTFTTTSTLQSGHNKWSKIKHDKAAADAKKMVVRVHHSRQIAFHCKLNGPNPELNPELANAIHLAKKAGVPKDKIEGAIARGQGKTTSGAVLESLTFEAVVPPSIALVVEAESEKKGRILQDFNTWVKKAKGTPGASKFFFKRVGRVVFAKSESGIDVDSMLDDAIEAGAEDIENDDEGNIVVWTEPADTARVCKELGAKFNLKALSAGIVWTPNEDTKVTLDASEAQVKFTELLGHLSEDPEIQAIYSNVARGNMSDEQWDAITEHLEVV
ncbi:transcriptional regulator TACO1-like protein [Podospora australis]|uniref:Transcriptional regulator TACO1-like protein n=1 Tax=Podospora australis TaxID=1536484 RepID=A0AAN6X348_9PEZI|nr:transcriptional regulator TACO1-like protein [Podospora australis]